MRTVRYVRERMRGRRPQGTNGISKPGSSRPTTYTALRCLQLLALGINALFLARLLGVHQYAIYARGAYFATPLAAVSFLGQDQLAFRHRIDVATLRGRMTCTVFTGVGVVTLLAIFTTSRGNLPTIFSSCLGSAGLGITTVSFVAAQANGRDDIRAVGQCLNAVTVQAAGVIAAYLGASAFGATTAATVASWLWVCYSLTVPGGPRIPHAAPFREGLPVGIGNISYQAIGSTISLVVAVRASDIVAARDRFVLLGFSALLGLASALNGEYFRVRLFHPDNSSKISSIRRLMIRANIMISLVLMLAVLLAGVCSTIVIPAQYGNVGTSIVMLAIVVPLLFGSNMLFNIELARKRLKLAISRNVTSAILSLVAILLVAPTPTNVVYVLLISEGAGFLVLGGAAIYEHNATMRRSAAAKA